MLERRRPRRLRDRSCANAPKPPACATPTASPGRATSWWRAPSSPPPKATSRPRTAPRTWPAPSSNNTDDQPTAEPEPW